MDRYRYNGNDIDSDDFKILIITSLMTFIFKTFG